MPSTNLLRVEPLDPNQVELEEAITPLLKPEDRVARDLRACMNEVGQSWSEFRRLHATGRHDLAAIEVATLVQRIVCRSGLALHDLGYDDFASLQRSWDARYGVAR